MHLNPRKKNRIGGENKKDKAKIKTNEAPKDLNLKSSKFFPIPNSLIRNSYSTPQLPPCYQKTSSEKLK